MRVEWPDVHSQRGGNALMTCRAVATRWLRGSILTKIRGGKCTIPSFFGRISLAKWVQWKRKPNELLGNSWIVRGNFEKKKSLTRTILKSR